MVYIIAHYKIPLLILKKREQTKDVSQMQYLWESRITKKVNNHMMKEKPVTLIYIHFLKASYNNCS